MEKKVEIIRFDQKLYKKETHPLLDWRVWLGGVVGVALFLALMWSTAIVCVLAGHPASVCGL